MPQKVPFVPKVNPLNGLFRIAGGITEAVQQTHGSPGRHFESRTIAVAAARRGRTVELAIVPLRDDPRT